MAGAESPQPRSRLELVLEALALADAPLRGREVRQIVAEHTGIALSAEIFGPLLSRARAAHEHAGRSSQPTIVRAIVANGTAARGLYARSDWPLQRRLVLPEADVLRGARVVSGLLAAEARGAIPRLSLTTELLRQLLGVDPDIGTAQIRIRALLGREEQSLRAVERAAIQNCAGLSRLDQLFGRG